MNHLPENTSPLPVSGRGHFYLLREVDSILEECGSFEAADELFPGLLDLMAALYRAHNFSLIEDPCQKTRN